VATRTSNLLAPLAQTLARVFPPWGHPRSRRPRAAPQFLLALTVSAMSLLGPVVPAAPAGMGCVQLTLRSHGREAGSDPVCRGAPLRSLSDGVPPPAGLSLAWLVSSGDQQ
jgi:hypothetical protein